MNGTSIVSENCATFLLDPEAMTIKDVNQQACEMLGYTQDELLSLAPEDIHPEDIEQFREFISSVSVQQSGWTDSLSCRTKEGDTIPAEISASTITLDGEQRVLALVRDVSERVHREQALENALDRTNFVLENTDTIIWEGDLDTDGVRRFGPVERLVGVPSKRMPTAWDFYDTAVHPKDRDHVKQLHEAVRRGEREFFVTEYRTNPDLQEDVRWIEDRAYKRVETPGDDQKITGLLIDVTDQKERERELQRQNVRLDEFSSIVSHDLRNPLNVVEGRLELARQECDSEHLDDAARAAERMNVLIDDLLTLAREGDTVDDTEPVDLVTLTENCWRNVVTTEATLTTEIDRRIHADQSRLQQLLENLVRNAVEHGGDDVTVTVGELDDGFYVEDDGSGIPKEDRDDVFEAGYSTAKDGTGFGLSIVKQVADAHGWNIRVTDGFEGCARFEITGVEFAVE